MHLCLQTVLSINMTHNVLFLQAHVEIKPFFLVVRNKTTEYWYNATLNSKGFEHTVDASIKSEKEREFLGLGKTNNIFTVTIKLRKMVEQVEEEKQVTRGQEDREMGGVNEEEV